MFGKQMPYVLVGEVEPGPLIFHTYRRQVRTRTYVVDDRSLMSWLMAPRRLPVRRVGKVDDFSQLSVLVATGIVATLFAATFFTPIPGIVPVALACVFTAIGIWRVKWGRAISGKVFASDRSFIDKIVDQPWLAGALAYDPSLAREVVALHDADRRQGELARELQMGHTLLSQAEEADREFIESRLEDLRRENREAEEDKADIRRQIRDRTEEIARLKRRDEVDRWLWK